MSDRDVLTDPGVLACGVGPVARLRFVLREARQAWVARRRRKVDANVAP